jgi:isocitrate lyase
VKRGYSAEDVVRLRGSVKIEHTLATLGAQKLWKLCTETPYVHTLGALTGNQAMQQCAPACRRSTSRAGRWRRTRTTSLHMYPDQSLYAVSSVPTVVKRINNALLRADQIQTMEGKGDIDWLAPIVADAESGFGGVLNAFELMKSMIDAGAAGVHFEDQLASVKKCGHMGGKVLVPTQEAVQKLIAARLAADVMGVPTVLLARTDAEAADIVTTDVDENDSRSSPASAPPRASTAPRRASTRRCRAASPTRVRRHGVVRDRHAGSRLREEIRRGHPQQVPGEDAGLQLLAVVQLEAQPRRRDHRQVPARAGRDGLQVPVHHPCRLPLAQLLDVRARARLRAQRHGGVRRAAAEGVRRGGEGFTAVKHQREVGTGYFDEITQVVTAARPPPRRCTARPRTSNSSTRRKTEARRGVDFAAEVARAILAGFDKHYRLFRQAAVDAQRLYERAAWRELQALARERIQMYDRRVEEAVAELKSRFPEAERDESLWTGIKLAYIGLLHEHRQPECAETFYNSVACNVLHRRYYHNDYIFWRPAVATEHLEGEAPSYRCFYPLRTGLRSSLRDIATSFNLQNRWEDAERDLRNVVRRCARISQAGARQPDVQIQVLCSLFFRNKAAYVIGRMINAHREIPVRRAGPAERARRALRDALLIGEDQLLVLFSFARAYFFVDMEVPAAYISFLRWLMPRKPRTELICRSASPSRARRSFTATCITT